MKCINCNKKLTGFQTKYCSIKCKSKIINKRFYDKNKKFISIYKKATRNGDYSLTTNGSNKKHKKIRDPRFPAKFNERYALIKINAKKRNLDFNISKECAYKLYQQECNYCGDIVKDLNIDRVDSNVGYTPNNIVACCFICNTMKHTLGINNFINHINKIIKRLERN